MSVLTALRDHLVSRDPGALVVAGARDVGDQDVINLQTYGGDPGLHLDGGNLPLFEFIAFQAMTRSVNQEHAALVAERVYELMPGRHLTLDGVRYDWIVANHRPAYAGVDEAGRALVVVNFTARRDGPATRVGEAA